MKNFYLVLAAVLSTSAMPAVAAQDVADEYGVIRETPEGTLRSYYKTSQSATSFWGSVIMQDVDGNATDIVFADDGSVYIKDPFTTRANGTWLKGDMEGDVLTIKTPQPIYTYSGEEETKVVYATRMLLQVTDSGKTLVEDKEKSEITFVLDGDNLVLTDDNPDLILGAAFEDGTWDSVGDKSITYALQTDAPVEAPDGEAEKYVINTGYDTWFTYVVVKDSEVYIRGISQQLPDAWVKGSLDGDKLTLSGSYLGVYDRNHQYFFCRDIDWDTFEYFLNPEIECSYDAETKSIEINCDAIINNGKNLVSSVFTYNKGTKLECVPADIMPDRPQAPEITAYNEYIEELGYGSLNFTLPVYDVNGNLLDVNNMFYNVYADEEVVTLYADDYKFADGDMIDIPYNYADGHDIFANKTSHKLNFYFTGFDRIGIQSVYVEDGVEYRSDITYSVSTGIEGLEAEMDPVSVIYTDMAGRMTEHPSKGLYIKTVTFKDGSVKNMKVLVK